HEPAPGEGDAGRTLAETDHGDFADVPDPQGLVTHPRRPPPSRRTHPPLGPSSSPSPSGAPWSTSTSPGPIGNTWYPQCSANTITARPASSGTANAYRNIANEPSAKRTWTD